jgi:hypothetical protein
MKKYLITGILLVLSNFIYAQCVVLDKVTVEGQEATDNVIDAYATESKITNSHYALKLDASVDEFMSVANMRKEFGHKAGGDFDKWKKRNGNNAGYYMFYTNTNGKVHLYHEAIDARMAEQFQQYLPKGAYIFDEKAYNAYFGGIDFSSNHWQQGGDAHARLADMRKLAVAVGKDLGITIDPAKITFRQFEAQQIEGLPPTRMYIQTTTPRNDNIKGFATWNDDVTSIEIDADRLQRAGISDAIRTMVEEVYHKYQMSEVEKLKQGEKRKEAAEKVWDWMDSFNDNNKNDYGKKVNDLQKQIKAETNETKRNDLEKQRVAAIHSYYQLKHEEAAKEFAGKIAAMEYAGRNITNLFKD